MTRFDAQNAECLVFTFKEGLLSAIAHDLKIRVGQFEILLDEAAKTLSAKFDASSLQVVCARAANRDAPELLSESDKRTIERNIAAEVLEARKFPEVRFEGALDVLEVRGKLSLHGVTRALELAAVRDGERLVASARIHQPDFGIRPYRAMLGALRVQADVEVRISIPADGLGA